LATSSEEVEEVKDSALVAFLKSAKSLYHGRKRVSGRPRCKIVSMPLCCYGACPLRNEL
jgi:hypothetical protein